jgi:hypothetical protein
MAKKNGNGKVGQAGAKAKTAKPHGAKQAGSLAAIIDPYLTSGGHTIKEIAAELAKKAGGAANDRDLAANVRARMVSYTRKGWRVEKDEQKRVKVVQKA